MKKITDVQDFIESYYPDYSRSQEIADEMDLFIANFEPEDMEEDSSAMRVFNDYSQEDHDNNQMLMDWRECRIDILERCIKELIDSNSLQRLKLANNLAEKYNKTEMDSLKMGEELLTIFNMK